MFACQVLTGVLYYIYCTDLEIWNQGAIGKIHNAKETKLFKVSNVYRVTLEYVMKKIFL
jgi:hypothetical protein